MTIEAISRCDLPKLQGLAHYADELGISDRALEAAARGGELRTVRLTDGRTAPRLTTAEWVNDWIARRAVGGDDERR